MPKLTDSKICKCRSHCTTLNPVTGLYEGEGHIQTRGTRYNHGRDDKRLKARASSSGSRPLLGFSIPRLFRPASRSTKEKTCSSAPTKAPPSNEVELILAEVAWHADLPVTTPTVPLVFQNNPTASGEYTRPSKDELLHPNHGLHALTARSRSNAAFIGMENRLCELASLLVPKLQEDGVSVALECIYEELARLDAQKQFHWEQQRPIHTSHPVVVNTGKTVDMFLLFSTTVLNRLSRYALLYTRTT